MTECSRQAKVWRLLWLNLLLWHRFDPWLQNFCLLQGWPKKKKKKIVHKALQSNQNVHPNPNLFFL